MSNEASYTFGNCTYYVAKVLSWVPAGLGDAKDWFAGAQARGLATTNIPTPGSVVVYGAGQGMSSFGHVAVVQSINPDGTFNVSEMNFNGFNQVDTRRSTMTDVLGFILPPGSTQADPGSTFLASTGGLSLPGISLPGTPDLSGLTNVVSWITDSRNWWRIGFVGVGGIMIFTGVILYFFQEESAAVERVAPLAAEVAA